VGRGDERGDNQVTGSNDLVRRDWTRSGHPRNIYSERHREPRSGVAIQCTVNWIAASASPPRNDASGDVDRGDSAAMTKS
jgi:hypothetical protein